MKLTRKNIISAISAVTAMCVAVTAICVANNRPETVIEYKIEDNFEITENMSVSFGNSGFTYDEFWGIPADNWLETEYSGYEEQAPSAYAEDYAGYMSDPALLDISWEFNMLTGYHGEEETVVVSEYVTDISGRVFDGNEYVCRIILPVSVTSLNMEALAGAPNLTEVVYLGTAEQWSSVYLGPGAIPEGVSVVIAPPRPETEETDVPGEESIEEETTVPTEEPADNETTVPDEETMAPDEESIDDTTEETTAPDEEPVDDTNEETTVPTEEPIDDITEDTTAPYEEPIDDTTEETTAPDEESIDDTTEETTAPDEEPVDDTTEETTVPTEASATEDTTSDTTVSFPIIPEYIPLTVSDTESVTSESIPETQEVSTDEAGEETTLPPAADEDTTIPEDMEESNSESETEQNEIADSEQTQETESEPEPETQTESETPKPKTISLISQLSGLSGGKTKIAARMSYFPTSAVVSVTNSAEAETIASQVGFDGAYYAFDVSVFDADTGELIPSLNGSITIDIGVPVILSESANIYAYHITDGVPQLIPCGFVMNNDGIRMVQFSASSFSPFVLTDHEYSAPQDTVEDDQLLTEEIEPAVEDENSESSEDSEENTEDESSEEDDNTEEVDNEPIIKVTFPSSTSFIINPYQLDIQVSDTETSNAPVISPEISITSESNCKIAVYMTATAYNIPDTVRYSDTYLTRDEEEKSIFMYAEAGQYDKYSDSYSYTNYFNGTPGQVPVTRYGSVSGKLMELDAVEEGSSAEGRFRLFGQTYMPSYDLWKENETVDVLMVFRVETVSDNIQELL